MKKLKIKYLFVASISLAAFLISWYIHHTKKSSSIVAPKQDGAGSSLSPQPVDPTNVLKQFASAFRTPINLYGKVVDQHGEPVVGATVTLTPVDRAFADQSHSKTIVFTESSGLFSVTDKVGSSIGVRASKDGYMSYPGMPGKPLSGTTVDYAFQAEGGKRCSNPSTPLILTLLKIGPVDPVFYVKNDNWRLTLDGTPRNIALDSVDGKGTHVIEFRLKCDCTKLPDTNERYGMTYDWSFDAKIPGGGFVEVDSDYKFEAPETGYQESIQWGSLALPKETWKRSNQKRYFVKFPDGSYGRIFVYVDAGTDVGPLNMTSWLNLKPGSRNLSSKDWDPTRVSE
jgi:hypothetical protein